ncbi:MAG: hypothetical protein K2M87_07810 [Muribaculaceae bacterium]|nr:hypothetical protein [Muribaculaceae bacterium]
MQITKKLISYAMVAVAALPSAAFACTSAIVSADANPYGRPILWKHRDTSTIDNKIEYIPADKGSLAYVALFNASDSALAEAWMGMNEAGFAVMNTASYNIKDDNVSAKKMDREGILMTKALRTCRTVEDFARLLETYTRPMGVEANFGVIDATGAGAYFETNNHAYVRYNLDDVEGGVLIRTNYSHSGRKGEGYGFVREANAEKLLAPYIDEKSVTPEVLTEILSRSFYHDLLHTDFTDSGQEWVIDQDFIPRYKSTATIAIEGCRPTETADINAVDEYVMWTGMGYPPVSEIQAVKCRQNGVPKSLRGTLPGGLCEAGVKAKKQRNEVFSIKKGNGEKYVNLSKLYNREGTGLAQKAKTANERVYAEQRKLRDNQINNQD